MFKAYRMAEQQSEKVRDILLLPTTINEQVHESATEQIAAVVDFFHTKMAEYNEVIQQNCRAVFVVNYVQNRFIATEFCPEIAKLFEVLAVKNYEELNQKLEQLKQEPEKKQSVEALLEAIGEWDKFLKNIDDDLDKTLGQTTNNSQNHEPEDNAVLGIQSKTISYYVTGSAFDFVLIVVVRSFNNPKANEHILELYKRIDELRKLGCDVFLLTKGPPIGSRGGAYIKLIGVPFRKLYDAAEAEKELRVHRKSAVQYTSWEPLCKVVESSLVDEGRPSSAIKENNQGNEEPMQFISQKGGAVLVNKAGDILYKHIEDEKGETWANIDEVVKIVETKRSKTPTNKELAAPKNIAKVDSEVSVAKEASPDKKKPCCIIC
ncbi:unnamed protein product [Caenorhabditis angaria]|uniref:Uncharacterized protein n=1 Tax=Caenorhabditis angaria TaxID=860376 RepID=A0A9P1ICA5_9PELO|nr:unnamed protein product [Caenorhabditis angaria]